MCGKISRERGQEGRVDLFSTLWRAWACLIRMRVGDIELGRAKVVTGEEQELQFVVSMSREA